RLERTPFGFGRPYTVSQMTRMMQETLFAPTRTERALFVPPIRSRMLLRAAPAWENVGARWFTQFSGVLLMEARKDAFARPLVGERQRRTADARSARPAVAPAPALPKAA
ncbi:MAG: methyltransferase type 11, partial [Rhodobacteraceae bacterium]|nr:methyltransferase type 11 [Paracoccaceae bacterium]